MIRFRVKPMLLGLLLTGGMGLLGVITRDFLAGSRGRDRDGDGAILPAAGVAASAPTGSAGGAVSPMPPRAHRSVDVAAGGVRTCAVLDDGTVSCWGNNEH